MAIALVQRVTPTTTGSGASITATFASTPTSGNLMVAIICSNDGTATNPSGWTTAINNYNATEDDFIRIAYKVAGASESTAVTFTGLTNNHVLDIMEFSGTDATPLDDTGNTARTTSVQTLAVGTTESCTTTVNDTVAIAGLILRGTAASPSINDSYIGLQNALNSVSLLSAYKILTASGLTNPSFSWTNAGTAWAVVAAFKISAAAPTILTWLPRYEAARGPVVRVVSSGFNPGTKVD